MNHIVMFSGGIGSWAAAKRVVEERGTDGVVLLFADTMMEDEDLYRFLDEAADNVGVPLTRIAEGRDPWQVFFDVRYLGNTRIDPCSAKLKRQFMRKWLEDNYDPADTVVYLGIDWTEQHRLTNALEAWKPWRVEAPLCMAPFVEKESMISTLEAQGITAPRLYAMGFPHNNCGGFCIKAGQAHFKRLLEVMPERFAYHERREQELREFLDKDVAILRDRTGGTTKPLTLRALRLRIEAKQRIDEDEWGGCGCVLG